MQLIVVPNILELIFFLSYLTYLAQKGSFEESNVYAHAKKYGLSKDLLKQWSLPQAQPQPWARISDDYFIFVSAL